MSDTNNTVAADELRAFIERVEHVEGEQADLSAAKTEIYAELKHRGYDAAVVREIEASEITVGDVITVQREGAALPVTHRVVSIVADPANPSSRTVELRGDANETNDLAPYTITHAKRVIASFPGFGEVLGVMRSPFFLAVTSVAVALLTIWAFWPQRRSSRHRVSS